jgi:hypothetical protein
MIPGEVVAAYLACNTAITQFEGPSYSYWVVFGLLLALMPLYLVRIMKITDATQIVLMCIAFVLWCITIDKPFDQIFSTLDGQRLFSTLVLTLFTFAVPLFYKGTEGQSTGSEM